MPARRRPILKRFFVIINIGVIFCYLLACLVPFVNTEVFWFIALLGLVFPIIFFILGCFILFWLIFRSRWWLISLIVLLLGFKQITSTFGFHIPKKFSLVKQPNTLRLLHWNLSNWDNQGNTYIHSARDEMFALIEKQAADILCFQEFYESSSRKGIKSNLKALKDMGFPYHYFIPSSIFGSGEQSGIGIFSKYPLNNSTSLSFSESSKSEHLLQTDVTVNGQIFRIMTTHLQSVRFDEEDIQNINQLKRGKNKRLHGSRTLVSKLKRGYEFRYEQAELVRNEIDKSPYPVIITGDFNDVPSSSTYFMIRGNLQDAFLKKGTFIGRTFRFISPTLRIDYILPDKRFKVTQYKRLTVPYSEHYGLVTDLELERKV